MNSYIYLSFFFFFYFKPKDSRKAQNTNSLGNSSVCRHSLPAFHCSFFISSSLLLFFFSFCFVCALALFSPFFLVYLLLHFHHLILPNACVIHRFYAHTIFYICSVFSTFASLTYSPSVIHVQVKLSFKY